ncbi:MAG TPA: hypothetical protein VGD05_02350, partial [Pyrinomonadaceae bacterium]
MNDYSFTNFSNLSLQSDSRVFRKNITVQNITPFMSKQIRLNTTATARAVVTDKREAILRAA